MSDQVQYDPTRSSLGLLAPAVRRWPLLLLLAAAGGVTAFIWFSTRPPVYESTTRLQVSKRYDAMTADGRAVFLEDYVATVTQIIASDEVLGDAHAALAGAKLAFPLPEDKTAGTDALKAALGITRVRDPNAIATTSSSVLSLRYVAGDPGDCQKVLEKVHASVSKYLAKGVSDALLQQEKALGQDIDAKRKLKEEREKELSEKKALLAEITLEELSTIRSRLTASVQQSYSLKLERKGLDRDLKSISDAGADPKARLLKLRFLLGTSKTGTEPAVGGPDPTLFQLTARRIELAERLGKDHPVMRELEAQIQFHQKLVGQFAANDPTVDELSLYAERLRVRNQTAGELLADIEAQIKSDEGKLQRGAVLQDKIDQLRRQLDDYNLEIGRQQDRKEALRTAIATSDKTSRAYTADMLDKPRFGRKIAPVLTSWLLPGVLLGLFAGVGLAYLAEMADQGFRSPAEIRTRLGVPVFGHIPPIRLDEPATADVSAAYDPALVVARRPKSVEAEVYRAVRAQLLVTAAAAGHKLIQVTSPNPGDGKSTTAANLAISLAQTGKRVALVDCDFRKPRVHKLFALAKPEVGLASVVDGATPLDAAVRTCDIENLFLLPCGPRPANPAELLAGDRFADVLADLKAGYDHVILDTPPLLVVSDPLVVAQRADAVVLVFGIHRRSRPQVERSKELLADTGATLLGVVVNGVSLPASSYGYSYSYSYSPYNYSYNYDYKYSDTYGDPDDASRT